MAGEDNIGRRIGGLDRVVEFARKLDLAGGRAHAGYPAIEDIIAVQLGVIVGAAIGDDDGPALRFSMGAVSV